MVHRILVVDDEEAVRSMVRDVLESQGFRVVAAGEFNEATRKIKETRPHVALITTIAPAHIENIGSLDAIADEKAAYEKKLRQAFELLQSELGG